MREDGRSRADVLASRALAWLVLAGYVAAVYAAVVVGIGAVLGHRRPDLALSVAATTIVAVTFERTRDAAGRLASRLIYGQRTTPYQALSRLSKQAAAAYPTDEVLPMMAKILADGLGAARSRVWLRVGETFRLAASCPPPQPMTNRCSSSLGRCQRSPGVTVRWPCVTMASCSAPLLWPSRPVTRLPRSSSGSWPTWPPRQGWRCATSG